LNINKSLITNAVAIIFISLSFVVTQAFSTYLLYIGIFALSGAITNVLAIHMLFEKVPFLYGSGIIELKFESFKQSIKDLMMNQFFTKEQLDLFFQGEEKKINLAPIIEETDFSPAFEALSKSVMESSFGGMLGMFGGEKALEALREPFSDKLQKAVTKIVESDAFDKQLQTYLSQSTLSEDVIAKVDTLIDARLGELTPSMVKVMMQDLMREHLGWLVVWGGVFGGVIGLISSFIL